jgi:transposase
MLMVNAAELESLDAAQLRNLTRDLIEQVTEQRDELRFKTARIEQLTFELARYKRIRFEASSEKLDAAQVSLLQETLDADLAAIEERLEQLTTEPGKPRKQTPRREALPVNLPRVSIHHEPETKTCLRPARRTGQEIGRGDFSARSLVGGGRLRPLDICPSGHQSS